MNAAVLILVLMEDTLRGLESAYTNFFVLVLILVLMEDTLRVWFDSKNVTLNSRLNPCFNGRYSQRAKTYVSLYTSIWGMFKLLETLLLT